MYNKYSPCLDITVGQSVGLDDYVVGTLTFGDTRVFWLRGILNPLLTGIVFSVYNPELKADKRSAQDREDIAPPKTKI